MALVFVLFAGMPLTARAAHGPILSILMHYQALTKATPTGLMSLRQTPLNDFIINESRNKK